MISLILLEQEKTKVASWWKQSLVGAGTGAVTGGAVGATQTEQNRLLGAVTGAGIGALGGAGVGAVSHKISKDALRNLKKKVDIEGKKKELKKIYMTRGPAAAKMYRENVIDPAIETLEEGTKNIKNKALIGSSLGAGAAGGAGGAGASFLAPKKAPPGRDFEDERVFPPGFDPNMRSEVRRLGGGQ